MKSSVSIRPNRHMAASREMRPAPLQCSSRLNPRSIAGRPDQAHRQRHRSPGPDYPRPNSLPGVPETTCSGCGHRQRQSASSNPPAKSQENHIIERRFHTAWVESRCGAVALGRTYLLPSLSFGGASMVPPWLRFHIPLIEPDMQISRIRLSDKSSRFRVQRLLQFLTIYRS